MRTRSACLLAAAVIAGCGGGDKPKVAAKPTPTVVDKIGTPPVRDIDAFGGQNLTDADTQKFARELTAILKSGDEKAFARLFDPRRPAVLAKQKVWLRNVRRVPMRERRVFLVGTTGNIDSSGKQELTADLSFEHQIAGVDRKPVAEWYRYGFRKRDGKLRVTSVRGAAPVGDSSEKFSRYYRQAWDDGAMGVARAGRAMALGPVADRAALDGLASRGSAAVQATTARLTRAGVQLPGAVRRADWAFTIPDPGVADFFDYFGGRVDPTEAHFGGFTAPVRRTDRTIGEPVGRPVTSRIVIGRDQLGRSDLDETLRHEMVHALLSSQGIFGVPTWVTEGAAVYFSDASAAERADLRAAGLAYLQSAGKLPSDRAFYRGDDDAVRSHYGAGYLAIAFLADARGERAMGRALGRLHRGDLNAAQFAGLGLARKVRAWAG